MKVYEYQAISMLGEYGIDTMPGELADSADQAGEIAQQLGGEIIIKAQVLTGGRGKAGGIKLARSPQEVKLIAAQILAMQIKAIPVKNVLIAPAADIHKEYYLGITIDRTQKKIVAMISTAGGVEIEEVAKKTPDKIHKIYIDPLKGLDKPSVSKIVSSVFKDKKLAGEAGSVLLKMYRLFMEKDCSLVEINPYAETASGKLIALDAKINFDDNSLFKHPEIEKLKNSEEYSSDEIKAHQAGLSFVSMDGDVGCIVNGAGLAMATMDMIKLFGRQPANFLDVGGSSNPDKVFKALEIILSNSKVKAILINIFGGITRCDDIAKGIIMAAEQIDIKLPLVIRLIGTNESEGRNILQKAGFVVVEGMSEAVKRVIEAA